MLVTGTGTDGKPRSTYLYHVVDNEVTMREYGAQCIVWQTALNPIVAWSWWPRVLLARVRTRGFDAVPFLDLAGHTKPEGYGSPGDGGMMTRYGQQFGPDFTFLGCRMRPREPQSYAGADIVIVGAPFDGGASHRSGTRFGPMAIRGHRLPAARRLPSVTGVAH